MILPLHLVRGKAHGGDRRLGRDIGGEALHRADEDVLGLLVRGELGFLLDLVHDDLRVAASLVLEPQYDEFLGLVGREAGNPFQFLAIALFLSGEKVLALQRRLLPALKRLFLPLDGIDLVVEILFFLYQATLELL